MRAIILTGSLFLAACAAPVVLDPPPTFIPDNIDFSGHWSLLLNENRQQSRGVSDVLIIPKNRREPVRRSRRSEPGSAARVFLESGKELKITQAESALFVSFDRSVVEEYRYGVLREVAVGPIEAQRSAGWVGDTLEIKTLDEDGALLTERWQREGAELIRDVRLEHKEKVLMQATQVFRRRADR